MLKIKFIAWGGLCLALLFLIGCTPMMKAAIKLDLGKYDEAIPLLKEALETNPDSIESRSQLGFAYLKTGNLDDAITEFETVLKAEPDESYSVLYLGMAYLNKERFADAIKVWQTYRDKKKPLVEAEIKRLLTLLHISEGQRSAKKALVDEAKLKTAKPDENTIAVCYFQDLSPDKSLKGFQKGLAAMVITDMAKIKSLKVIERLRLQALLEEMKLGQTGIVDAGNAPRIGRLLGAESLITGNLSMGSIQVTTSLASTSAEGVKGTATITVEKENFFELPSLIIRDSAKIMGITLSQDEIAAIGIPHTKNYKAFIYYGQALDAIDAGRWEDAKNLFDKALAEDPAFSLAREGGDSSPGSSSPGIGALATMTTTQISSQISTAVTQSEASQTQSDASAAASANDAGRGSEKISDRCNDSHSPGEGGNGGYGG